MGATHGAVTVCDINAPLFWLPELDKSFIRYRLNEFAFFSYRALKFARFGGAWGQMKPIPSDTFLSSTYVWNCLTQCH